MASLNKVMIIGNLGTDPEMRFTQNGSAQTTFRVAASRNYTGPDGDRREETEWFSVVAWNKLAETCSQFLQKGRRVYVEGRLQTRSWEGQDGRRNYRTEVIANTVLFLDRGGSGESVPSDEFGAFGGESEGDGPPGTGAARRTPMASRATNGGGIDPDDLPFE